VEAEVNLKDVRDRMVDLKRSGIDWDRSDPVAGQYHFNKPKVYLRWSDYKDSSTRLDYVYRWVAYDDKDDFRNINKWKWDMDADFVYGSDKSNEVWPELIGKPGVDNLYHYMDMVLMKIPLLKYIEKREEDASRYDKAREGLDKKFRSEAAAEGAEVTEVELKDIRGTR
jgi:hypothetical protein